VAAENVHTKQNMYDWTNTVLYCTVESDN